MLQLMAWLEEQEGAALLSDDAGRWAVVFAGTQPVTGKRDGQQVLICDEAISGTWENYVDAGDWKPSILEALKVAFAEYGG